MKKYIYLIALTGSILAGCDKGEDASLAESDPTLISFSAGVGLSVKSTDGKAGTTTFPNNGEIALLAANSSKTVPDWNSLYISNQVASTTGTGESYDFSWANTEAAQWKYWPFNPDQYLTFAAYSPATHASFSLSGTVMSIKNEGTLPDILYINPVGPFNKAQKKVDLGTFQHALSKLVVNVIPIDKDGNEITGTDLAKVKSKVAEIYLKTKYTQASLDLSALSPSITSTRGDNVQTFKALTTETSFPDKVKDKYFPLLFPYNTPEIPSGDEIIIGITLNQYTSETTHYIPITFERKINEFLQADDTPVFLEAGKITTLNIRIKNLDGGDLEIKLDGVLTDWVYKGNSDVTIQ